MANNKEIKTTKTIYPQIYAYTLPQIKEDNGWVKIGYTERKDVNDRIREQVKTAAVKLTYQKLWSEPAKFNNSDKWFFDKELHTYLRKFKEVDQRKGTEWFYYDGTPERSHDDFNDFRNGVETQVAEKLPYQLRAEQADAVNQTLSYLKNHPGGEFLWNAKPRFGKTLTTYDLVRQMNAAKVLIVTNRPAIANSWFDDFEKFIAWQTDFAFVSTSDSLKDRPAINRDQFVDQMDSGKDRMLAFISLQDLKGAISFGGGYDKLEWVAHLDWDLLVIDEAHEGIDTFKTDVAFDNIKRNFTLHLSGTPFKAVASGKFNEDQIYNWTYADEQIVKANWNDPEISNPYTKLPKLNLFSYQMSQMITDQVNSGAKVDGENIDFAFDLNEFFDTKDNGKFVHESEVIKWLDTLTHNEKYPFSTKELRDELKHTFWILNRVASAKALQKLLEGHPVFENYKVVLAAGDGRANDDDQVVNQKSLDRVRQAIKENEKTITLSVGQLTTGVTIPEWTGVLMLSNMKSPSLYMQAAFRSQNPWEYVQGDEVKQKQNAYVFDFAPERTLTIYDEFANNLSSKTSNGGGTTDDRKENIRKLLNFFPVVAEDINGKMIELDVNQVLTIPKTFKAQEVVRRGFMSNLLFRNIGGIFANSDAREILEDLNPVDQGKVTPRQTSDKINTQEVTLDDDGNAVVDKNLIIAQTSAHFGQKVYGSVEDAVKHGIEETPNDISNIASEAFKQNVQEIVKDFAKEKELTTKTAEKIVDENAHILAREVETIKKQTDIEHAKLDVIYNREIAKPDLDSTVLVEIQEEYEAKKHTIDDDFKRNIQTTVVERTKDLAMKSAETVLKKTEEKKKATVEEDVRARLRGFARTIPSFLMAYGEPETNLANFDETITDSVFKEVTGITLDQFRTLRDKFNFFDDVVFDESVQEFLRKRKQLANYFDETQDEDIFDYIPPQQTNQIFTPKKVVKMMIDKLEEENPEDFADPNKTFVDLYMKSGLYIAEIVKRLYVGLEDQIPDNDARLKHILENQVYGFAPSKIIYNIARNFIFGFDEKAKKIDDSHVVCLDTTPFARGEGDFETKCDELFGGKN